MSDVNLEFNVNPFEANLNVTTNEIIFTPSAVNMTMYAGGIGTPAGGVSGNSQVQYNNNGILGGSNQFTYVASSASLSIDGTFTAGQEVVSQQGTFSGNVSVANLTASYAVYANNLQVNGQSNLNNISNVTILGGTINQFMRTNGAGTLSWQTITLPTPGGTGNSIQFNDAGELNGIPTAYWDSVNGRVDFGSPTNIAITGGINGYVLQTDGEGNLSWSGVTAGNGVVGGTNTNVQFNDAGVFGGNVNFTYNKATSTLAIRNLTSDVQITANNFTSSGNVIAGTLTVNGTSKIQQAKEKVTVNASSLTGTVNYDVLDQAVLYYTSNIAGNITVNFRGNGTNTFDSIANVGESYTLALLTTVGSTVRIPTVLQVDGNVVVAKYAGNLIPNIASVSSNTVTSYSYTLIKTAGNTYTILASFSGYK